MREGTLRDTMSAAHECAATLLESASHIRRELAEVQINDALRAETKEVCDALVGTGLEVISELDELEERSGSKLPISPIPRVGLADSCFLVSRTRGLDVLLSTAACRHRDVLLE